MKVWYRQRELFQLLNMFRRAVDHGDAAGAGSMYGCLFDLLQTARSHVDDRKDGYAWKRMVTYLEKELDDIQIAAADYPITVQQALVAKIILNKNMRKSN